MSSHNISQIRSNSIIIFLLWMIIPHIIYCQSGELSGTISYQNETIQYATVSLSGTTFGAMTNQKGHYVISGIPYGTYDMEVSYIGYQPVSQKVVVNHGTQSLDARFSETSLTLDAIVVSGTKTFKRKTSSAIVVNVIDSKTLNNVQACNLSEGLKFQPGIRVETDCQTCNYTQLRINGLSGGYSQILINGRPIFSPLTGLYGLEQLPANMIERIEVIRGGGSSLYGSSAIGGTVNVITKVPKEDSYELNYNYQSINGQASDHQLTANALFVSDNKNSGASFFLNRRERGFYDHNDDNFSEIPLIDNTSIGASVYIIPKENQKIELSLSHLNEYRYGGEMIDGPAYLSTQSEERTHSVWMASVDHQISFNNNRSSLIGYMAWQNTTRDHYTGILPDEAQDLQNHFENPPYGLSEVATYNTGIQLNHQLDNVIIGRKVLTIGAEYIYDSVYDQIDTYNYLIDQTTKDIGLFLQSDWEILPSVTLLSGVRLDKHNLVEDIILSPRASFLYKLGDFTQFRLSYGSGFRAPQALDTDLHIAFAGGGISRVNLSPDLVQERSKNYSASVNFDKPTEHFVGGITLEGFYTRINDAFFLDPIGEDNFGEVFVKKNGQAATVRGATLEFRANYNRQIQVESGFTVQSSRFDNAVQYIEEVDGIKEFIRTPDHYGFANLNLTPNKKWSANINYVYTGTMKVPHFAGAPNQVVNEIITSESFSELSTKVSYNVDLDKIGSNVELYGGIKNITGAYQGTFDIGKNRDSNFVYGPAQPRTYYIGIKVRG